MGDSKSLKTSAGEKATPSLLQLADSESALLREGRALRRKAVAAPTSRKLLSTEASRSLVALAELVMSPGRFNVTGGYIASTSSGNVKAAGVRQWKMILHEDFHRGTVT